MLHAIQPLSFVKLAIGPRISADTLRFAIDIKSFEDGSVGKLLKAFSVFEVVFPLPFVNSEFSWRFLNLVKINKLIIFADEGWALIVNHDSFAVPFSVDEIAIVDRLFVFFEFKLRGSMELLNVDILLIGLIVFEKVDKLLDGLWGLADRSYDGAF
jgi:hypothetical protein